jgi:hypothetical protein
MFKKINKSVGPPLSVWCGLLEVDGADLSISRKHFFDFFLSRKLSVDGESDKESRTILISQIIPGKVTHNLLTFVKIRKLNLKLASIYLNLVLLSLIIGSASAANQFIPNECIRRLRLVLVRHYLNPLYISVNEEMRIELLLCYIFWEVPHPKLSNS